MVSVSNCKPAKVGKAALNRDPRDRCAEWRSQEFATRLPESFGLQELQRSASEKMSEMLFQGAPGNGAHAREVRHPPSSAQISAEEVSSYPDVTRERLVNHLQLPLAPPYQHLGSGTSLPTFLVASKGRKMDNP